MTWRSSSLFVCFFFSKRKTAYERRISDWSSAVCSSDLRALLRLAAPIALIALVNMGMSVTDTVMVSAIFGTDALAAVAVGSDLYSIVFYLSAGVLGGIAPFYTAAVTRSDPHERARLARIGWMRSEEHTSELQSLMRHSYAVFCLK